MGIHTRRMTLTFALIVAAISPTAAQDKFELPLSSLGAYSDAAPTLSLGSVGLDSKAGNSHVWYQQADRYYFDLPSERSFRKAPGLLLRIPLGDSSSH
jgi:hypothetical protein